MVSCFSDKTIPWNESPCITIGIQIYIAGFIVIKLVKRSLQVTMCPTVIETWCMI